MVLNKLDKESVKTIVHNECISLLKEYIAVSSLENFAHQIRWHFISREGMLPELDAIQRRINQVSNEDEFHFIVDRFRTCWSILNPVAFTNAPIKDLSILNRFAANFTIDYDQLLPQEIDKDLLILDINRVHPRLRNKKKRTLEPQTINNRYLKALQKIVANKASEFGWILTEEFILEHPLIMPLIPRDKILKLSEYLIREGFISSDDQQSFIGCFNSTLNVPEKKIVWRDINAKTHEPTVASLCCLFKTLGLKMTLGDRITLTKLFCLPNDKIKENALKARNNSPKLTIFKNDILAIVQ